MYVCIILSSSSSNKFLLLVRWWRQHYKFELLLRLNDMPYIEFKVWQNIYKSIIFLLITNFENCITEY